MDPELIKKIIEALKNGDGEAALTLLEQLLAGTPGAPAEGGAPDAAAMTADAVPMAAAAVRAIVEAAISDLTGQSSLAEAAKHVKAVAAKAEAADRAREASELEERRTLIAELVRIGVETPATAWKGEPKDRTPCDRLAAESVSDMRTRVTALRAARPATRIAPPTEPEQYSETVRAQLAKMTPVQRENFDRTQARFAAARRGA